MKRACPCLSQQDFSECCEPYINGRRFPETPEKLMRSRYSAYHFEYIDYLIFSHHPSKRSKNEKNELSESVRNTRWLGLIIHKSSKAADDSGEVDFSAYYTSDEDDKTIDLMALKSDRLNPSAYLEADPTGLSIQQIHERSTFVKENQQWFYYSGDFLPDHQLSRNDLCFCGSLKKYKRCHRP